MSEFVILPEMVKAVEGGTHVLVPVETWNDIRSELRAAKQRLLAWTGFIEGLTKILDKLGSECEAPQ